MRPGAVPVKHSRAGGQRPYDALNVTRAIERVVGMGRREASAYKRVNLLMLPAIILGVFVPMVVESPLSSVSRVIGTALMVAAVVAFFGTSRAAQEDYERDRAE